jgi:bifunctional non-homologous end joining protein LigD
MTVALPGARPAKLPGRTSGYRRDVPPAKRLDVDIDGRVLSLSNLDKVLFPRAGFTKGQVIDYYTRIAPAVLPHLRGRPLTLKRYPDGVEGPFFYEKQSPAHRPEWVRTAAVWSRHNARTIEYTLADDLPTLVWLAQLGDLELHTSLALARAVEEPTILAFDLDPGPPATIVECAQVALDLREAFDHLGMAAFPKTSGSKGMQVYVPLNVPGIAYADTKSFALGLARLLERRRPELVVSDMKKSLRTGKVLVDWSQNDEHKTTVSVYSLRARERPTVSTPLHWEEVEAVLGSGDPEDLAFTTDETLARVTEHGDLFAPVLELEQPLPRM